MLENQPRWQPQDTKDKEQPSSVTMLGRERAGTLCAWGGGVPPSATTCRPDPTTLFPLRLQTAAGAANCRVQ